MPALSTVATNRPRADAGMRSDEGTEVGPCRTSVMIRSARGNSTALAQENMGRAIAGNVLHSLVAQRGQIHT